MRDGVVAGKRGPLRIAVLAPLLGGSYTSSVIAGDVAAAGRSRARVVGIQTLDVRQGGIRTGTPRSALHTGWDQLDGFVALVGAADRSYLEALRAAGKPVVTVADEPEGFECPAVRADNRGGIHQAVAHLVGHGHRRIAFAGCLEQADVRERLAAYRSALVAHGIVPDASLVVETPDSLEGGGEAAARRLVEAGLPSTAVVAATDFTAMGVMKALTDSGLGLPRDQAVVGFDDMPLAASLRPTLASVHQSFETLGSQAATLVIRMLRGHPVKPGSRRVPTSFIPRESCGCTTRSALQALADPDPDLFALPRERLRHRLGLLLFGAERPSAERAALLDGAVGLIAAESEGGPVAAPERSARIREAAARLHEVSPRWTTIAAAVDCLREYHRELRAGAASGGTPGPAGGTAPALRPPGAALPPPAEAGVTDMAVEISRELAEAQSAANTALHRAGGRQFRLSMALLGDSAGDCRALTWLEHTPARAACLGLWAADPAGGVDRLRPLHIAGSYVRDPGVSLSLPRRARVEEFPPLALVEGLDWRPGEMLAVLPVCTPGMELGILAVLTPAERNQVTGRDQHFETSALLGIALERELMVEWLQRQTEDLARAYKRERDLVEELRLSQERLRHTAQHDPLTGLANRSLFLERMTQALARSQRNPHVRVGLLFLDLDRFKQVNDHLGHLAGDRLLVEVAERISQRLRRSDTAARLGGDEFAILLEDVTDLGAVQAVAGEVAERLSAPYVLDGEPVTATASVGLAISTGRGERPDDLLREADTAMYAAKVGRRGGDERTREREALDRLAARA